MSEAWLDASEGLRNLLRADEELRWRGTPHRSRLLAGALRGLVPVFVILGMVGIFVFWMVALAVTFSGGDHMSVLRVMGGLALVVVLVVGLVRYWIATRRYDHAEYAATDRRLISFTGAFGRDASSVDWGSVRDLEVTVGALDGLFGTGTIHVATEGRGDIRFRYVEDPHALAATLDAIRSGEDPTGSQSDEWTATQSEPSPSTDADAVQESVFDFGEGDGPEPERRPRRSAGPGAEAVSATLEGLLREGEELRWHYRPPVGTYLKQSVIGAVLTGLLFWSLVYGIFAVVTVFAVFDGFDSSVFGVSLWTAVVAGWVLVQIVWVPGISLGAYRASDRLEFAATDQRAIKVGGMVGLDTSSVDWDKVTDIEVSRSLMTKLFGTGYVVVKSGGGGKTYRGGGVRFGPVEDPLDAVESIQAIRRGDDGGPPILVRGAATPTPSVDKPTPENLSAQARTLLSESEDLLWCGRPSFLPFVAPPLLGGIGLTALGLGLFQIGWGLFALFVVFGGLSMAGKRLLAYRNAEYVATDRRILAFGGGIGRDSSSVDWADVHDVEVETGPFDGPFGTGTLRFSRAGSATAAERQQTGGDSKKAFTGVRFQRVPNARSIAEVLERGRAT